MCHASAGVGHGRSLYSAETGSYRVTAPASPTPAGRRYRRSHDLRAWAAAPDDLTRQFSRDEDAFFLAMADEAVPWTDELDVEQTDSSVIGVVLR
jgi:hypothetical protein